MATLAAAPFGLKPSRRYQDGAATFMTNTYYIQNGYGTAIGYGDPVVINSSGYITRYANGGSNITGVFLGLLPYFDTNLQQVINRPNYLGTEAPPTNINVGCLICDDKTTVYQIQVNGTGAHNPVLITNIGDNADIVIGTPTAAGISTSYLDSNNVATTGTFPLRIVGLSQEFFLGYDPTVYAANSSATPPTNNYVEVILNTSSIYATTGL